jgi:hypothetical protein
LQTGVEQDSLSVLTLEDATANLEKEMIIDDFVLFVTKNKKMSQL